MATGAAELLGASLELLGSALELGASLELLGWTLDPISLLGAAEEVSGAGVELLIGLLVASILESG